MNAPDRVSDNEPASDRVRDGSISLNRQVQLLGEV